MSPTLGVGHTNYISLFLIGNYHAKIGNHNRGYEEIMGKLGEMTDTGERSTNMCTTINMGIGSMHKMIHGATWVSPDL
ncbi:hypothetical protein DPMN_075588 [Dreissena polymorpha]|uniref:Uncharacterized protein n=1 Tax=Dreissena polymorpha TaxID=45954 RepID=A0A9D3YIE4_DREPO|nr:hypothetical protein DPMN_075588 [Dreissena polymorpha]